MDFEKVYHAMRKKAQAGDVDAPGAWTALPIVQPEDATAMFDPQPPPVQENPEEVVEPVEPTLPVQKFDQGVDAQGRRKVVWNNVPGAENIKPRKVYSYKSITPAAIKPVVPAAQTAPDIQAASVSEEPSVKQQQMMQNTQP